MKVLTFGEIMLRLKAPGHERFFQSPMLEATFGGGEANVAVSLANYGMDAEFLSVLPQNDIADACIRELRYFGVDTEKSALHTTNRQSGISGSFLRRSPRPSTMAVPPTTQNGTSLPTCAPSSASARTDSGSP